MRAFLIGMIVYCVVCVVLLWGISLYREFKEDRAIQMEEKENPSPPVPGMTTSAAGSKSKHAPMKHAA